jgi:hypothetical protein
MFFTWYPKEAAMNINFGKSHSFSSLLKGNFFRKGTAWALIIVGALIAFEIFNYSTTQFALLDVLGDLKFSGVRWATILALAFCGIDFAGIARLFSPDQGHNGPAEVWYLFGAWLLAAAMNATLTWWGVAVAITNHANISSTVISATTLTKVVPIFVAVMVWLIRVLIIGTFSASGGKFLGTENTRAGTRQERPVMQPSGSLAARAHTPAASAFHSSPKTSQPAGSTSRLEPTYTNLSMNSKPARDAGFPESRRLS